MLTCVSASGHVLPPMMVYPRKKSVPENIREGAVPGTVFANSDTGWINANLFLEWFKFFIQQIPSARPILLIQDGHTSHTSIELIELARDNNIHLLCLPPHTTHVLQPLDVGVFKSFKANFSKACMKYLAKYPGRVVTVDKLASLVAEAWPLSLTTVNVLSGFKKCGIFPLNPGEVTDRQLAPSKAVCSQGASQTPQSQGSPLFTKEKEELFRKRYGENCDIRDPEYIAWLKIHHPEVDVSPSETSSLSSAKQGSVDSKVSKKRRREPARAKCLTNDSVLDEMKSKVKEKEEKEEEKRAKALEREEKRRQKEQNKRQKEERKQEKADVERKKKGRGNESLDDLVSNLKLSDSEKSGADSGVSDAVCPTCGVLFSTDCKRRWVGCDGCGDWYHVNCTYLKGKRRLPEHFFVRTVCER